MVEMAEVDIMHFVFKPQDHAGQGALSRLQRRGATLPATRFLASSLSDFRCEQSLLVVLSRSLCPNMCITLVSMMAQESYRRSSRSE
jgi:hypothetical protein